MPTANSNKSGDQISPSITTLSNGDFVVVWQAKGIPGIGGYEIAAQRFTSAGVPIGGEMLVNSSYMLEQCAPKVVALSGVAGGYAVIWENRDQNGNNQGIYKAQFDNSGQRVGSLIDERVDSGGAYVQGSEIVALAGGGYAVAWSAFLDSNPNQEVIQYKTFAPSGTVAKPTQTYVDPLNTAGNIGLLSLMPEGTGGFYMAMSGRIPSPELLIQGVDINGNLFYSPAQQTPSGYVPFENGYLPMIQYSFSQISLDGNRFAVSYSSSIPGNISVFVYDYAGDTNAISHTFGFYGGILSHVSMATLSDGDFVVIWEDYTTSPGVLQSYELAGQRINSDGTLDGQIFKISDGSTNINRRPVVTALANGEFSVAWEIYTPNTGDYDIGYRVLDSSVSFVPGSISIAAPSPISIEGSTIAFTVSLAAASTRSISVSYSIEAGGAANTPAASATDIGTTGGTITFAPGELTKTITLPLLADGHYELPEAFTVRLSNPVNATISNASAAGFILNDWTTTPGLATQTNVVEQNRALELGTTFAMLSYGEDIFGQSAIAALSRGTSDGGFNDDYRFFIAAEPGLAGWELLAGDKLRPFTSNDVTIAHATFTPGGLYHGYISVPLAVDQYHDASDGTRFGNSNAIVVKNTSGTMVIGLRGTDEKDSAFLSGQAWSGLGQYLHYQALRPLIMAALDYAANPINNITEVIVAGHSLGGAMADIFAITDARYFAAIPNVKTSIVSLASAGIDPDLVTDGFLLTSSQIDSTVVSTSIFGSLNLVEPANYIGASHNIDRVYFQDNVPVTLGLNPTSSLIGQANFDNTVFNLPNIANKNVDYPITFQAPFVHGFGAHHNGGIYLHNIKALIGSPLIYTNENVIFGVSQYSHVGSAFQYDQAPISDRDYGLISLFQDRTLSGTSGIDFILGLEGDDDLRGKGGADKLDGGFGFDRVFYDTSPEGVIVNLLNGTGQQGDALGDRYVGIEGAVGSAFRDIFIGDDADNSFTGGKGNDVINGGGGVDTAVFDGYVGHFKVEKTAADYQVIGRGLIFGAEGPDSVTNTERFQFGNATLSTEAFTPVNFNHDLKSDIIWTNAVTGQARVFVMDGTSLNGTFDIGPAAGVGWQVKAVGDLDGNGSSDLVWQHTDGRVTAYLMDGVTIKSAVEVANPGVLFRVVAASDLNGDGNSDIVLQNTDGQAIGWLMEGTKILTAAAIGEALGTGWTIAGMGDITLDGKSDMIWTSSNGQTRMFTLDGTSVLQDANISVAYGADFKVKGVGDLNGDGLADIVWQFTDGQAGVWFMQASRFIGDAGYILTPNGANVEIRDVADLNGDGKMDLVWQNTTNGAGVGWLLNGTSLLTASAIGVANGTDWFIV